MVAPGRPRVQPRRTPDVRAWPGVRIVLRGDSAFCRHRMLDWCERHRVGYLVELARNAVIYRAAAAFEQADDWRGM